jgi:hypothetical protein
MPFFYAQQFSNFFDFRQNLLESISSKLEGISSKLECISSKLEALSSKKRKHRKSVINRERNFLNGIPFSATSRGGWWWQFSKAHVTHDTLHYCFPFVAFLTV